MLGTALRRHPGEMPVESQLDNSQATNFFTPREMLSLLVFCYFMVSATLDDEPFAEMPPDNLKDLKEKS